MLLMSPEPSTSTESTYAYPAGRTSAPSGSLVRSVSCVAAEGAGVVEGTALADAAPAPDGRVVAPAARVGSVLTSSVGSDAVHPAAARTSAADTAWTARTRVPPDSLDRTLPRQASET